MMKVLKKKILKCFWVRKLVDIDLLIIATVPLVIVEVVKIVNIGIRRPATIPQVIAEVMDVGKV